MQFDLQELFGVNQQEAQQIATPFEFGDDPLERKRAADADKAEIAVEVLRGRFVDRKVVQEEFFTLIRTLRDTLMNISDRVSPVLVGNSSEFEIAKVIREEIRVALEDVSGRLDA